MKQLTGKLLTPLSKPIIGKVTFKPVPWFSRKNFIFLTHNGKVGFGYAAILTASDKKPSRTVTLLCHLETIQQLVEGDILSIGIDGNMSVLYEINTIHNFLLLTEQCNCSCKMCPNEFTIKNKNNVADALKVISLINKDAPLLGITGGEPTLMEDELIKIIKACKKKLPDTTLLILSNGIKFANFDYVKRIASVKHPNLIIDIPIHSDTDTEHNRIAGADGFYKTIEGLYNLARFNQKIGIRIVVHKLNYKRLPQLSEFIYRNFPFVCHIAFMQMETTGMAKTSLDELWVDPYDYNHELEQAIACLNRRAMNVSIYNTPLCILPTTLWKYAKQSISTWKNIYLDECVNCVCKNDCAGFFSSSVYKHSQHIKAIVANTRESDLVKNAHLETILNNQYYASSKIYRKRIEEHWVYFSPNNHGLPVIVTDATHRIFEAFQNGRKVSDLYYQKSFFSNLNDAEFLALISTLIDHGFLKKNPESELYQASQLIDFENITDINVWLHITNQCNLQCDYCFVHKSNDMMSEQTIKQVTAAIINTAKTRNLRTIAIKFSGGEPTLVLDKIKRFYHLLKEGLKDTNTKISVGIISNGTLVNHELLDFLKQENCSISISLDGYGIAGHDIYRKFKSNDQGSWKIIEENITQLIEHGISPYIMSTISEASSSTLTELMRWIIKKDLSARLGLVSHFNGSCANSACIEADHKRYVNNYINAFETMFMELEKEEYPFSICKTMRICDLHFDTPAYDSCCGLAANHIVINHKGKLTFCPMALTNDTHIDLGNDLLVSIRKTVNFNTDERNDSEHQKCLACQWFPVCVGGCIYSNIQVYQSPFALPLLHDFYEYVIPRYIDFYGKKLLQQAKQKNIVDFQMLGEVNHVVATLC